MQHMSRTAERKRSDRWGYWVLGGCGVVVVGIVSVAFAMRAPERDRLTGCIARRVAIEHVAVIDRTDPLKPAEQAVLKPALKTLGETIPKEDRFMIVPFDGGADVIAKALFVRCRPQNAKEVSSVVTTVAVVERTYQQLYLGPLEQAVRDVVNISKPASETHLAAFIANLAAQRRHEGRAEEIVLHVFSDFAEHTPSGTLVAGKRKPMSPDQFSRHVAEVSRDRLKGVRLELHVMSTGASTSNMSRIKQAWSKALGDVGATFSWRSL